MLPILNCFESRFWWCQLFNIEPAWCHHQLANILIKTSYAVKFCVSVFYANPYFLPKMILNGVAVILWFIVSGDESQVTIDDKVVKIKDHEIIGVAIYVMVIFLPSIYFWICVNSFYRKLKNDEIGPHFRAWMPMDRIK